MVPERHNAVKVLIFFDVGGSMDPHIRVCEELFSAARLEFKHMEYFYFHNFVYESVWKNNIRRMNETSSTWDILHKYTPDYKVIFVRSEEHTSELQSRPHLVCRLLLEKKKQ